MRRLSLIANLRSSWRQIDNGQMTAPVSLMTPGVRCGSYGCVQYSAEVLAASAPDWNGIAVTLDHPADSAGLPVSVHDQPQRRIGRLRNARFERGALRADAVIAAVADPGLRAALQAVTEVSLGAFVDADPIPLADEDGQGRVAHEVATALRPDHLALLPPGTAGACSWADGAGVRANAPSAAQQRHAVMVANALLRDAGVTDMIDEVIPMLPPDGPDTAGTPRELGHTPAVMAEQAGLAAHAPAGSHVRAPAPVAHAHGRGGVKPLPPGVTATPDGPRYRQPRAAEVEPLLPLAVQEAQRRQSPRSDTGSGEGEPAPLLPTGFN